MSQTLLEKLQLKDEKSLLIQGLPSSIEKQFIKLAFSKNVTPWLKNKKIDFALVFAVNEIQLKGIINEVLPALHDQGKLWVAIPKTSSKIATTLNRECSWSCLRGAGFEEVNQVPLDHVWTALHFRKICNSVVKKQNLSKKAEPAILAELEDQPIENLAQEIRRGKLSPHFFNKLSASNKKEYASWLKESKETPSKAGRLQSVHAISAEKKSPSQV